MFEPGAKVSTPSVTVTSGEEIIPDEKRLAPFWTVILPEIREVVVESVRRESVVVSVTSPVIFAEPCSTTLAAPRENVPD